MKLLILICSLLAVAVGQDPSLSCNYRSANQIYMCELFINNPNGFDNFTEIGGIHLEGFSDADVNSIYRSGGSTTNIPQIICDTFPNINIFEIYGTQLTEINDNALSGCSQIRRLYLFYNRIATISENAFANLREVEFIDLGDNVLTTLPENVFENQQNLTGLSLNWNLLNDLPTDLFRPLENLVELGLGYNNLSAFNNEWFSTNSNMLYLSIAGNRLNLTDDSFGNSLQSLIFLNLGFNAISEIPTGTFASLTNLNSLQLYGNNIRVIQENTFADLDQLSSLDISSNPIERIDDGAFQGLDSLVSLSLSGCRLRDLSSISFENLTNLASIDLNFNEIEDIDAGTFAPMPNLVYVGLWNNRLKTLRRNSFGTLTELRTLDLDGNIVNALDRAIIDDAVNLNTLYFNGNLCANSYFGNFFNSRATYLPMLEVCFRNMRYIVDTTTESDGVYSFFEGPQPGIVLRVQSDNEVQIALTPFSFVWTPSIEIFIGSANNTRSVIRVNEETDVVTVPTPNAIQQNQWNDFRVTWANQNVLVFRSNETFPFMSYTMQHFFPVNFYGLRAVESRATWSVQPLDF
ncbi:leucine-rich repeat-containing G-protein coupled receptor 5-like isoform X2 [Bradysia coprophila]|uniref:leucine-rich repeat-containing G-protein coupled receptor 5-like isoform X2 n=1 Tax=Bradysia coprophila TaxID=38358 RepID=UPI00187D8D8B|nr:leucine-rich repeat-containing G-protein coupled receptor 5-like isoform X2 [Bradysia coprophila]